MKNKHLSVSSYNIYYVGGVIRNDKKANNVSSTDFIFSKSIYFVLYSISSLFCKIFLSLMITKVIDPILEINTIKADNTTSL
ncbi:hypothetical protein NCCP28_24770 [Niallia sp. NCCP-28]|nr:hypothetical protein NCCP28_24770 [Niallia sp. NCCP-28]